MIARMSAASSASHHGSRSSVGTNARSGGDASAPARRGFPWTLWLHIFKDMARLILLTAGVLVTVIAFAASVKPLADGQLTPVQCVKFMGLAMLPMLQYALPFAACFGATLAYYRLASDNEVNAAHAGGLSHRTLLMPSLFMGALLAVVIWYLANFSIPRFLRGMSEMVSQNATQFVESSVLQGRALETRVGDQRAYVYADYVRPLPAEDSGRAGANTPQYDRLWLTGILFVSVDDAGNIQTEGSAREAFLWIRKGGASEGESEADAGSTEVVLQPVDYAGFQASGRAEGGQAVRRFRVPNKFRDDPKFMTLGELRTLSLEPDRLPQVDRRRKALAMLLAESDLAATMKEDLRAGKPTEFTDGFGARYRLWAADIRPSRNTGWWRVLPARGQRVRIDRIGPDGVELQGYSANYAEMKLVRSRDPVSQDEYLSASLRLSQVSGTVSDEQDLPLGSGAGASGAGAGQVEELPINELIPASEAARAILNDASPNLLTRADEQLAVLQRRTADPRTEPLQAARRDLVNRTADLLREIVSKHHERMAMSAACLVMVLTGGVMAMRLRDRLPLTIYLWAFFPALAAVLTISTGQQLTHQHGLPALLVLWGGVAALGAFTYRQYRVLARH